MDAGAEREESSPGGPAPDVALVKASSPRSGGLSFAGGQRVEETESALVVPHFCTTMGIFC